MDNMSEEQVARLSEEQRREKRKERILKGSQKRMAAILSMDGGKRQAPCVEGMGSASSSDNAPEAPQPSLIKRTPSQPKTEKLLDFEKDDTGAPYKTENIIPVPPKYMEFVDKQRFWIAFLIGLLSANLTLFLDHVGNLIVPVLVLIFSYEAFVFKTRKAFCPKQDPIWSQMMPTSVNMDSVTSFGLIIEILRKAGMDLVLVTFSFISSRLFFDTAASLLLAKT